MGLVRTIPIYIFPGSMEAISMETAKAYERVEIESLSWDL